MLSTKRREGRGQRVDHQHKVTRMLLSQPVLLSVVTRDIDVNGPHLNHKASEQGLRVLTLQSSQLPLALTPPQTLCTFMATISA